jgi:hypothetical protein
VGNAVRALGRVAFPNILILPASDTEAQCGTSVREYEGWQNPPRNYAPRSMARKMPPDKLIKRQQRPTRANVEVVDVDTQETRAVVGGWRRRAEWGVCEYEG